MINHGMANLQQVWGAQPGANQMLAGLQGMIDAQLQVGQPNPELDQLTIAELQTRFDSENAALQSARAGFEQVLLTRNPNMIQSALQQKQQISQKVIALSGALGRKGIAVGAGEQPQCVLQ